MADNFTSNPGSGGVTFASDDILGIQYPRAKMVWGADGVVNDVSAAAPLPITMSNTLALTDTQLRATAVPTTVVDAIASGTLAAAAQTVVISMAGGLSAATVQITGTWAGTIQFEGTVNGTDWTPINGVYAGTSFPSSTITANGLVRLTPAGLASMRVNMTAFTSGSAVIAIRASGGVGGIFANQILPTRVTDGVSTQAIKPANTAALASDSAAVVTLSPNGALPQPDVNTTGTITTTDIVVAAPAGAGALLTGASTTGSFVFSAITGGYTAWAVQITGLTTGTIYFEASTDSTTGTDGNWINVIGRQIGILNSLMTGVATGNGNWRGNVSAYRFFRVRSVGVLTGTPAIIIRMSAGLATVFLNGSIPTGQNVIGGVNIAPAQTLATVSAVTAITNALPTGANTIGAVNQGTANAAAWLANPLTSQITAEASSAKIATGNSAATIVNASSTGVMLFLNASVVSGTTPSLTVSVQVQDPVSAAWVNLPGATYAAVVAVTATPLLLIIDLGVVAVANAVVNMPLPRSWRLAWVISGTTPSFTFSVGAQYLV